MLPLQHVAIQHHHATTRLTSKAGNVTLLRLLLDDKYPPQHFTKVYDNPVAKIYRINYGTSYAPLLASLSVSRVPLQVDTGRVYDPEQFKELRLKGIGLGPTRK